MNSDPELRRWYLKYNKMFFRGELPTDVDVWWAPCGKAVGWTFLGSEQEDGAPPQLCINIDPCLGGLKRIAKQTLIHEMAHVSLWHLGDKVAHHGRVWDAEIQRLTKFFAYRRLL